MFDKLVVFGDWAWIADIIVSYYLSAMFCGFVQTVERQPKSVNYLVDMRVGGWLQSKEESKESNKEKQWS